MTTTPAPVHPEASDYTLSAIEKIGKYGLPLTTLVTVYLFLLGRWYWTGYFADYKVDASSIEIPLYRYLVPCRGTYYVWSNGVILYLVLKGLSRIRQANQPVNERAKSIFLGLGISEEYALKFMPHSAAFNKLPNRSEIAGAVFAGIKADGGTSIAAIHTEEFAVIDKESFLRRVKLPDEAAKQINDLTPEQFYGLRSTMLVLIRSALQKGGWDEWDKTTAEYLAEAKAVEASVQPGPVEKYFGCGLSLLMGVAFVALIFAGSPMLVDVGLGALLGTIVFLVPRIKAPDLKYIVLLLVGGATLEHAEANGRREGKSETRTIYIQTKDSEKEKFYERVFESPKGVYVLDSVIDPKDKGIKPNEALRLLPWSEIKTLRYRERPMDLPEMKPATVPEPKK